MALKLQSGHDFVTETATYKVQRGITHKIYIQELWFLRSAHRLMLVNISMTVHEDILNGFQVIQSYRADDIVFRSRQSQSLRGITKNTYMQELWFLRSAYCLMLDNISMTFHEDILNGFQATERMALYSVLGIAKVRRDITQKYIYPRVMVLAICTSSDVG